MWQSFSRLRHPLSKQRVNVLNISIRPGNRLETKWRVAEGREDQHADQEAGRKGDGWPGFQDFFDKIQAFLPFNLDSS